MGFSVNELRGSLSGGGARPTLFEVQIQFPTGVDQGAARDVTFKCTASAIPNSRLGAIGVPYKGRVIHQAGDRSFDPWNITLINDEDFKIRDAFENWSNLINARERNIRQFTTSNPLQYKTQALIKQFSRVNDTTPIRTYVAEGVFPTDVSSINLGWGDTDQIEYFQVQLSIDWWSVEGATVQNNVS